MFWTNIKRISKAGFIGFWRNGYVSLAAVLVMVITLTFIGSVVFLSAMLNTSLGELQSKVDVNVYFITTAQESEILSVKRSLEALPEVASVEYVSREQALEDFRLRHEGDQLTLQALDELGDNPLGAILNVRAKETSQYESIANFLGGDNGLSESSLSIIDKVNFFQNRAAIERLSKIIEASEALGLAVIIFLVIMSALITFNTIRLAIYSSREEISVMRLVGAENKYIRGPFVIVGMMYGAAAAIITLALFYPVAYWLGPTTERFFGAINLFEYYVGNFGMMFAIIFFAGIILGGVSSYLAVKKYLKV